jgi:hypothetical protein
MQQNSKNYKRYYFPHHFIFLPLMTGLSIVGFTKSYNSETNNLIWLLFGISSFCILYLAIMLRQHYALGNQNRIVRLEFRLRYFELFGESANRIEKQLTFAQIAALRFANDSEFKRLLEKTLSENLGSEEIIKSITDWQADHMRV